MDLFQISLFQQHFAITYSFPFERRNWEFKTQKEDEVFSIFIPQKYKILLQIVLLRKKT